MNEQATHEIVDALEDNLRNAERQLERIGAAIGAYNEGGEARNGINRALEHLRDAIRACYQMRPTD